MTNQDLSDLFDRAGGELGETDRIGSISMADFDESVYRPFLDGIDMEEDQKSEFLSILWDMMRCFVEWNVPPESWGQVVEVFAEAAETTCSDVE